MPLSIDTGDALRRCFILTILVLLTTYSSVFAEQAVTIWHIPHPDDETLGMAGGIMAAADAGRRNIVVFYTQGGASGVLWMLNGYTFSRYHGRYLEPAVEGYAPLSRAQFKAARVAETRAALKILGVADEDIFLHDFPDGGLEIGAALSVMRQLAQEYPLAAHRTTALDDPHQDHQNLAKALLTLYAEHEARGTPIDILLISVYQYNTPENRRRLGVIPVAVPDMDRKVRALAEFSVWDPENGRFAVGMHSVPDLFKEASVDRYEYVQPVPKTISSRMSRDPKLAVSLFTSSAKIHYGFTPQWTLRLSLPYTQSELKPALLRKTHYMANTVRLYAGPGYEPRAKNGRSFHWIMGAEISHFLMIEYNTLSPDGMSFGWRFAF